MFRLLPLLVLLIALCGAPVAALDLGQRTGPVMLNPGTAICDTAEEMATALRAADNGRGAVPEGCGIITVSLRAYLEIVGHVETARGVYVVLKILFLPPMGLGVQYGWMVDPAAPKGISA